MRELFLFDSVVGLEAKFGVPISILHHIGPIRKGRCAFGGVFGEDEFLTEPLGEQFRNITMFIGRITGREPFQIIRGLGDQGRVFAIQNTPLTRLLDKTVFDELCDEQTSRKTPLWVTDIEIGARRI
jgi:hypothetical protein